MDNGCFGEGMLLVAECLPDADPPLAAVWHTYSVANTKGAMQRCVFPMSTGTKCMLTVLSKTGAGNRICNSVTSWATIHYLVCLKVTSSFETQGKKESWIKDPYSVYRNTTPTNNVVARGAAWERLAMASFNDYELKLKKKIIGNLRIHSTDLYLISQEELIKKNEKWKKDMISSTGNFLYGSRTYTHSHTFGTVSSLQMCRYPTSNPITRTLSIQFFWKIFGFQI